MHNLRANINQLMNQVRDFESYLDNKPHLDDEDKEEIKNAKPYIDKIKEHLREAKHYAGLIENIN